MTSRNWWWSTETRLWDEVFGRSDLVVNHQRTYRWPRLWFADGRHLRLALAAVGVDRIHFPCSHANARAQEAVEQYREHDQGKDHVHTIAFDGESYNGEGYSGDGSGNEE